MSETHALRTVKKIREDLNPQGSREKGLGGLFESTMRRFKTGVHALTLIPLYGVASICLGLSAAPGLFIFDQMRQFTAHWPAYFQYPALAITLGAAYFSYGFTAILLIPLFNRIFVGGLKPWRGAYYSLATVRWYIHNGLTYIVRYTFLPFITPTPFNILFYKAMGMKIGSGTIINTEFISDPSLIELGNKVTIGGSATIIGHYGVGGYLIMAKVKVGDGATVGLKATIMAGVVIGAGAKILPNSLVLPNTQIPAGETWGGVPAQRITK